MSVHIHTFVWGCSIALLDLTKPNKIKPQISLLRHPAAATRVSLALAEPRTAHQAQLLMLKDLQYIELG